MDTSFESQNNKPHDSQHVLALYRLILSGIAGKTPYNELLQQLIDRLEQQYAGCMTILLLAGTGEDQPAELFAASMPPGELDNLVNHSTAQDILAFLGQSAEGVLGTDAMLEAGVFQQACLHGGTVMPQLLPVACLPVRSAGQTLLGGLILLQQENHPFTALPAPIVAELPGMISTIVEYRADQKKIQAAHDASRKSHANMMRMALAIEGSATGIWDRDIQSGEIHYSPGWKAILGYADHEVSNRIEDSYTRLHPEDQAYVRATMQAHFEGETESYAVEHRVRCKDGSYKWISSRGKVVSRAEDGKPLRMLGTTTDITAMRTLSERLQQSVDLVTCLTNEVPGLAYQYRMLPDGEECFSYVSEGIRDIYELTPAQINECVALIHERIHPDDFPAYRAAILASSSRLEHLHHEYRVNLPQQGMRWRQMDARPRRLPDGETLWHGFITDVTEHKRIEQELQELATTDFLTQIPNRRSFMGRMEEELARIHRGAGNPSAVLMCDLDNFKIINDTHGHAAGDLVLRHFANILQDELRKTDYAGRVGGEEFAVVLAGANVAEATVFAQRIQKQMRETPVNVSGQIIPVTVSIGIAVMQASDIDADVSLSRSDMALYQAKESGRNRIIVAVDG
ncbi:sensor domain-containing diguanylate cyclase [Undibacterium sp. Ji50W]|uniref:sensor domain-containing diguanylate cyclase n=1 Tax=Undibacterium sp. Ji50W TaxID=3413041 RepID=UPI003BF0BF16